MNIEQKLNEIEKQNKQILFLLNLLISESGFSTMKWSNEYSFLTSKGENSENYKGRMDKSKFTECLNHYAKYGIPQEILNEIIKTK